MPKIKIKAKMMPPVSVKNNKLFFGDIPVAELYSQSAGGAIPDTMLSEVANKVADVVRVALSNIKPTVVKSF